MHTPSFLTRNAGALAHHHPSSVLSPDDDDLDDVMMMIQWAAETHFLKLPKYVCRVVNRSGFLGFLSGCIAIHGFWCHWWKTL
jgi:hypothetical protein